MHGPYDDRRSWIKVLEYCALGIPWVASQGPAYADLAQYGRLVRNQPIDWEKAILATIDGLSSFNRQPLLNKAAACSALNNIGNLVQTYERIIKQTGSKLL